MVVWEEVRRQVAIFGTVSNEGTGKPISGARVEIVSAPPEFTDWLAIKAIQHGDHWDTLRTRPDRIYTQPDGHYHFMDLPDGSYTVQASIPEGGSRFGNAQVTASVARDVAGDLSMVAVNLALPATTIAGQVNDLETNPVGLAEIRVLGSGESTFSDSGGQYSLTGLETGNRTIQATGPGYQSTSQSILLSTAGAAGTLNFSLVPDRLTSGLYLWLRTDSLNGLSDGDLINLWPDSSGHGFDVSQSTEANRPTFQSNVINGLPGVRLDGTDDFLLHDLAPASQWSGDFSLFIIATAEILSQSTGASLFSSADQFGASVTQFTHQIDVSSSSPRRYRFHTTSTFNIGNVVTTFVLLEVILNGTSLETYYNGSLGTTTSLSSGEGASFSDYIIGVNRTGDRFFRGDIAEILLYNRAVTAESRQEVEQYLSARFGLTFS